MRANLLDELNKPYVTTARAKGLSSNRIMIHYAARNAILPVVTAVSMALGFAVAGQWLGSTRLSVAAFCVGRAQRALQLCLDWAATRVQFGQPIGKNQGVSFKLADMATRVEASGAGLNVTRSRTGAPPQ